MVLFFCSADYNSPIHVFLSGDLMLLFPDLFTSYNTLGVFLWSCTEKVPHFHIESSMYKKILFKKSKSVLCYLCFLRNFL